MTKQELKVRIEDEILGTHFFMTKQKLEARIEEIIDENKAYIADVVKGWDVREAEAQNEVLELVLSWVSELK